ncbi:FHIPEP family type III secretion protein, partial [Yersinia pestis]
YEKGEHLLPDQEAFWVSVEYEERLEKSQLEFFSHSQVLTWHLSHVLREYAEDFIGIQETRYLLEQMEGGYGELIK